MASFSSWRWQRHGSVNLGLAWPSIICQSQSQSAAKAVFRSMQQFPHRNTLSAPAPIRVRFSQFEEQNWEEDKRVHWKQPTDNSNSAADNPSMNNSNNDRIEVKETDMKPNMVTQAMDIVRDGLQKYSQDKDIASFVKDTFEKQFGPTWHCVVGKSFGSRVSYELETFALFKKNQHTVLVFKCG